MLKQREEFQESSPERWRVYGLTGAVGGFCGLMVYLLQHPLLLGAAMVFDVLWPAVVVVGLFAWAVICSVQADKGDRRTDERFNEYLESIPLDIQKRAALSPELSAKGRRVVAERLNARLPGWSLD